MDDIAIIDAHHHFWDLARNYDPWLAESSVTAAACQPVPTPGPSTGFLVVLAVLLLGLMTLRASTSPVAP